jgi:quercetin dioxygenase-like cupin family protein
MQQIKTNTCFLGLISILFIMGCKEAESNAEKITADTTNTAIVNTDNTQMPAYDPALEPLKVGASFSKLLHDTLDIKMYEFTLKPGDSAALHAHPDHTVYVLQGGKALIYFNGGGPTEMDLVTGTGFISPAITDAGKNIGTTTIKLLVTDIYRPRVK